MKCRITCTVALEIRCRRLHPKAIINDRLIIGIDDVLRMDVIIQPRDVVINKNGSVDFGRLRPVKSIKGTLVKLKIKMSVQSSIVIGGQLCGIGQQGLRN